MTNVTVEDLVPKKLTFGNEDLKELFGFDRSTVYKLRQKGWFKSLPDSHRPFKTTRPEVIRYVEATQR